MIGDTKTVTTTEQDNKWGVREHGQTCAFALACGRVFTDWDEIDVIPPSVILFNHNYPYPGQEQRWEIDGPGLTQISLFDSGADFAPGTYTVTRVL